MWQTKYAAAIPKNLGLGLNSGRAMKAISSLGVRSPCERRTYIMLSEHVLLQNFLTAYF